MAEPDPGAADASWTAVTTETDCVHDLHHVIVASIRGRDGLGRLRVSSSWKREECTPLCCVLYHITGGDHDGGDSLVVRRMYHSNHNHPFRIPLTLGLILTSAPSIDIAPSCHRPCRYRQRIRREQDLNRRGSRVRDAGQQRKKRHRHTKLHINNAHMGLKPKNSTTICSADETRPTGLAATPQDT